MGSCGGQAERVEKNAVERGKCEKVNEFLNFMGFWEVLQGFVEFFSNGKLCQL